MSDWMTVRHYAAIAGSVTEESGNKPISGAKVSITAGPQEFTARLEVLAKHHGKRWMSLSERFDQTYTTADGHFHFLDLPNGDYTLIVSSGDARGPAGTVKATVSRDAEGNGRPAGADVSLAMTPPKDAIPASPTGKTDKRGKRGKP